MKSAAKRKVDAPPINQSSIDSFFKKKASATAVLASSSSAASATSPSANCTLPAPVKPSPAASDSALTPPNIPKEDWFSPSPTKLAPAKPVSTPSPSKPVDPQQPTVAALTKIADEPAGAGGGDDAGAADAQSSDLGSAAISVRTISLPVKIPAKESIDEDREWTEEELSALRKHYKEYTGLDACYAIIASLIPGRSARRIAHKLFDIEVITYKQLRSASFTAEEEEKASHGDVLSDKALQLIASSATVRLALPWISAHLSSAQSMIRNDAFLIEPTSADDFSYLGNGDVQTFMDELPLTTVNKGTLSYWAVPAALSSASIARLKSAMKQAQKLPLSPAKRGNSFTSPSATVPASQPSPSAASKTLAKRTFSTSSVVFVRTPSYSVSLPSPSPSNAPSRSSPSLSPSYSRSASYGKGSSNAVKPASFSAPTPPSPPDEEMARTARREAAALDGFKLEVEEAQDE